MASTALDPTNLSAEDQAMLLAAVTSAGLLSQLPASKVIVGDEIEYHDGLKISLPKDMPLRKARDILKRVETDQETEQTQVKQFNYRPFDGAVACARVMRRMFGITFGERMRSFFRDDPPQTLSVPIGLDETLEVPWGLVSIPSMEGFRLNIGQTTDSEYGKVFAVNATYLKKHTNEIKKFFVEVEQELKTNSIYRGQAIVGLDKPQFLDMSTFRSAEIVFSDDVEDILNGTVWSVLKYRDQFKRKGIRTKRAALLYGPYGCGKTSALLMTAEVALANGWTYIKVKPGENVNEALKLARLYAPAVVAIEDIDNEASTAEGGEVSKLLETFDGVTSKGAEIVVVMTTNHKDRVHKGMLRPGRLDAVVEIAELDRGGVERLVKAVVAEDDLDPSVDYDEVYAAMQLTWDGQTHGFLPAFVREALERAKAVAISSNNGGEDIMLNTHSLVVAAKSLHTQYRAMLEAEEGQPKPVFDGLLRSTIREEAQAAVHDAKIVGWADANTTEPDRYYALQVKDRIGSNGSN